MDPKATLLALEQAVTDGNHVRAVEMLNTYYQWRVRDQAINNVKTGKKPAHYLEYGI